MTKKIPYAIASFEEIREKEYIFIDKTNYIRELENYKVPVFLRPRRFGKSLWCSLLECYYDINRKDKFDFLFGELNIGHNPTPNKNKYLVMRFDFSKVEVKADLNFIERTFSNIFKDSINSFIAMYKELNLKDFSYHEELSASEILSRILSYIKSHNLPPLYLIIDEYDNFANQLITTHQDRLYYELTTGDSFLRSLFKVIKAGIGERSIEKVFITGVLPITIDDLTSGFNIAEIITLEENTLNMLGFTQEEVDNYLAEIYESYEFDKTNMNEVKQLILENYNGYKFLPDTDTPLYNSTILTYFLKKLTLSGGKIPLDIIDENLRTEFNMNQFFERDFYPLSLFYLGMLTFKDNFKMRLPNLTMKQIFTEYFNAIENIEVSKGYTGIFERFVEDLDIEALFQGYWDVYVKQLPAQIFDRVNENFYRTTFYELCTRYLSHAFTFAIENNYPSGRSDWEMLGNFHTKYKHQKYLVEFRYYSNKEGNKSNILKLRKPRKEDIEQVKGYESDILTQFPYFKVRSYLIYIVGNKGFRCFEVSEGV